MKGTIGAAVALVILCWPLSASASDEDAARGEMRRGLDALAREELALALEAFERASKLAPSANAPLFYAAETLVRLGRFRDAVTSYEAYLAVDPSVSDAEAVRQKISSLRADHFPARLRVRANVPDALLDVDGTRQQGLEVELDPGPHALVVRTRAGEVSTRFVRLRGDEDFEEAFVFVDRARPASRPAMPLSNSEPLRTTGWVVGGVGAAGLFASFLVDALVLGPTISDYRAASARGEVSARSLREAADHERTGVIIGYSAAGLLVVGGALLVLLGPRSNPSPFPSASSSR